MLDVTRIQYPLAPLAAGTYNNDQGKTIKGVDGHTIDFSKPDYFSADDYTQHLYMILGRILPSFWFVWRTLMYFLSLFSVIIYNPCGLIDPAQVITVLDMK